MKKINLNIIISIISIVLIIVIICIMYNKYMKINANKVNDKNDEVKEKLFNTEGSEKLFTMGDIVEVNINDKKYAKIYMTINNNTLIDASMSKYSFETVTSEDERISICSFEPYNYDNLEVNDMFPKIAIANNITSGYLYCQITNQAPVSLKMRYIVENDSSSLEGDIKIGIYHFDIKNKINVS